MHIMRVLKFFVQSACFVYQVLSSKSPLRDQRGICHVFSQLSCSFPGRGFRSKVSVQWLASKYSLHPMLCCRKEGRAGCSLKFKFLPFFPSQLFYWCSSCLQQFCQWCSVFTVLGVCLLSNRWLVMVYLGYCILRSIYLSCVSSPFCLSTGELVQWYLS